MASLFSDLAAVLRQEMEHYRRLLALAQGERGRIVKGELRGLTQVIEKKEGITRQLAELESLRTALMTRLAGEMGEPPEALTLARLGAAAGGGDGKVLQALLLEFRALVGRLVAAQEVNRTLLDRSLEWVHGSLALFRPVAADHQTYGKAGQLQGAEPALPLLNHTT